MGGESNTTVWAALAGNAALAVVKFVAAAFSGSSAMLSEGIHSSVDTLDQVLLLVGRTLSKRPPDKLHPFGHGLELYFWTFIVAVLIFAVGGGASAYEGIIHVLHAEAGNGAENASLWNYVVLGCGFVFEGISWWIALGAFRSRQGQRGVWQTIRETKDPTLVTVLLEDSAALVGLLIALIGVVASHALDSPYPDGVASIAIGVLLMIVSVVLAAESRKLLIGESANATLVASIRKAAESDAAVQEVRKLLTMHFGPHEILVLLSVQFREAISSESLVNAIERIEKRIRTQHSDVRSVSIEAQAVSEARRNNSHSSPSAPLTTAPRMKN